MVDAILADLGVASPQIDDPARGFSYRKPGPLDMRMNPSRGQTAAQLLAKISPRDLLEALRDWGDEEDAEKIVARESVSPCRFGGTASRSDSVVRESAG